MTTTPSQLDVCIAFDVQPANAEQLEICGYMAGELSSPSWAWVSGGLDACVRA